MPDAPEVKITEITGSIEVERGFEYGEGEPDLQGPGLYCDHWLPPGDR